MIPVAVVGKGRNATPTQQAEGWYVGQALAQAHRSVVLVTGGMGGVMATATEGFHGARRDRVSLGFRPCDQAPLDPDPWVPIQRDHPGCTLLDTGLSTPTRNVLVASLAVAVIACPGSHGTAQELTVAIDRGTPIAFVGDHDGTMTGDLRAWATGPETAQVAVEELAEWVNVVVGAPW